MKNIWIRFKEDVSRSRVLAGAFAKSFKGAGFNVEQGTDTPQAKPDFCLALGGDGTLLATIRKLGAHRFDVPVLGVHTSTGLGFMHSLTAPQNPESDAPWCQGVVDFVVGNKYTCENRWGLECENLKLWALNDFVVSKGPLSRMIDLKLRVGSSVLLQRMRGDGLIVSSAMGSTAYSLSAGGPVVQPTLDTLVVTPICPHEVSQRPIVLDGHSSIKIEMLVSSTSSFLTSDGQTKIEITSGQSVEIRRSAKAVQWVVPNASGYESVDYFEILRSKLRYGGV